MVPPCQRHTRDCLVRNAPRRVTEPEEIPFGAFLAGISRPRGHRGRCAKILLPAAVGNIASGRPCASLGRSLTRSRTVREPRQTRLRRLRRQAILALIVVLAGLGAVTARWFVWPPQGMPARVDAIVMLNGPGDRLDTALDLAWAHRAPMIVISRPTWQYGHGSVCAPKIPGVKVICFVPKPATTRGEAEFAGRLARRYQWRSVVLVAVTPQDTVARLRVGRCFSGKVYVVNAPLTAPEWLYEIAYQWGSTIKALSLQRTC